MKYNVKLHQKPITQFTNEIILSNYAHDQLFLFYKSHKLGIWGHIKSKSKKIVKLFYSIFN